MRIKVSVEVRNLYSKVTSSTIRMQTTKNCRSEVKFTRLDPDRNTCNALSWKDKQT